ncbi:lipoyl synthase [Desulfotignum phosphitoxidans]|uniref:Multifunctional fusion protein n=1 Tax=Desulfotignum phosphitoxidans DSM 13687 TaxID=1286635 RepID=S0G7U3_9BACT|nr:lipoyl synthase [Desulfotignum phosphitoxidans]EMS81477.1 lipoyl synthase LipA [Desulfotignum phosphitoxidans DSM 13687]
MKDLQTIDLGRLDYDQALSRQHQLVADRIKGHIPDSLILVEHPPVITIGRSGSLEDLRVAKEFLAPKGVYLQKVDRGGRATFHGPGQLVIYPIINISDTDIHVFLTQLTGSVSDVLEDYHLVPELKKGQPGLWVNDAKIASVGLAVKKKVTYHGIALNVSIDPHWFDLINPCGQKGAKITSMDIETGEAFDMSTVKKLVVDHFSRRLGYNTRVLIPGPDKRPKWLIKPADDLEAVRGMETRLERLDLATVCQTAHCPNQGECFHQGTATFMILGTRCTRRCRFCAVDKGIPYPVDYREPERVAMAVSEMGLTHAVVTSVTRDDLPDGGAGLFAATIHRIRQDCPDVSVEVLVPDFQGQTSSLETVCAARPDVFNHNIETVPRLYDRIRPKADYRRSLRILSYASDQGLLVKSGLMLGLGETCDEIKNTLNDLKSSGCQSLTIGQYLAPSGDHAMVARYVPPEEFDVWAKTANDIGFKHVSSGPLVRSSYHAGDMIGKTGGGSNNGSHRKAG